MSRSKWSGRAAQVLSGHIDRLRYTLGALGERLRASISQAIGGTVAGAVQDAVYLLLEAPDEPPSPSSRDRSLRPAWRGPEDEEWPWYEDRDDQDDDAPREAINASAAAEAPAGRGRWGAALAVGCQAAAWWLRREAGRFAGLKAVGVGLLSALTAYVAGPVVVAGVCLAHSALSLQALAGSRTPSAGSPARDNWNRDWR
jgi:hypothetical protein